MVPGRSRRRRGGVEEQFPQRLTGGSRVRLRRRRGWRSHGGLAGARTKEGATGGTPVMVKNGAAVRWLAVEAEGKTKRGRRR